MEIISRAEAMRKGLSHFFTGKACGKGHIAERYVNGGCVICKAEYLKRWNEENKEKRAVYKKQWREDNIERISKREKEYYEKSKKDGAQWLTREHKKAYREKNRESIKALKKKYYHENAEDYKLRSKEASRWRRRATPSWADKISIKNIELKAKTLRCQGKGVQVDHIIPFRGKEVCGLHIASNMRIISRRENAEKYTRFEPYEIKGHEWSY